MQPNSVVPLQPPTAVSRSMRTALLQPPIHLEGQLGAWQFSGGLQLWVFGSPARCTAFAVQDRELTLLPASRSSCPSLTLCLSLPMMESTLTSTS